MLGAVYLRMRIALKILFELENWNNSLFFTKVYIENSSETIQDNWLKKIS